MHHSPSLARDRGRPFSQSIAAGRGRRLAAEGESSPPPPPPPPPPPGPHHSHHSHHPSFSTHSQLFSRSSRSSPSSKLPPSPPHSSSPMEASPASSRSVPPNTRTLRNSHPDTPPDSQSSSLTDLRRARSHSRSRSLSTALLGESLLLLGRRTRRGHPPPQAHPPPLPTTTKTTTTAPSTPSPPPIPPKHPRPPTTASTSGLDSSQLPQSPPRISPRTAGPTGSPVRQDMARNPRVSRRSLMQPSERESREFTKANTLQVQKRLAEVEATMERPLFLDHLRTAALGIDDDPYTSLDGILASYGSSDESTDTAKPARALAFENRYIHLDLHTPPDPSPQVPRQLEWPTSVCRLPTPPQGCGGRLDPPISITSPVRPLDIESAFSSLGGFGSGGIWRKIAALLEPWDVARLARVSQRMKRVVEPLLYESITLRPNYPHGFSYSYLSHLLAALHCKANRAKLQRWTKSFRLGRGWEENQITLLHNGAFLTDEEIIDPDTGRAVVSKEQMKHLVREEGLLGDGGIKEVNAYMSDILERTPHLTSFTWDSPIPLRGQLLATLATATPEITSLTLDLSQPMRKQRHSTGTGVHWAPVPKYRPNIATLSTLPLASLRLRNLPTRGGEWWMQVWGLIAACIPTLRLLALEMPHITHARYHDLFDRFHRIHHLPAHDDDERHLKTPPVFDHAAFAAAKRRARTPPHSRLRLHTLELAGFVVDGDILTREIAPRCLRRLVLAGCVEMAGFRFPRECWRGIDVFRCTGLGFVERAVEALEAGAASGGGRGKEVAFLNDDGGGADEAGALEVLRGAVVGALGRGSGAGVARLVLKEQWALGADEVRAVFSAAEEMEEVALAVDGSEEAWAAFGEVLAAAPRLGRVHVLNGFSARGGTTGTRRRYVVDDAALVAGALVAAWEAGKRPDLQGVVVAVGRAAWKIVEVPLAGGKRTKSWGMERIPGALGEVVVGSFEGRGEGGL